MWRDECRVEVRELGGLAQDTAGVPGAVGDCAGDHRLPDHQHESGPRRREDERTAEQGARRFGGAEETERRAAEHLQRYKRQVSFKSGTIW